MSLLAPGSDTKLNFFHFIKIITKIIKNKNKIIICDTIANELQYYYYNNIE